MPDPSRIAKALGRRFIQRTDVKAIQYDRGWAPHTPNRQDPTRIPWRMEDLLAHIEGRQTFGHYMVGTDDQCKLFAFDLDLTKEASLKGDGELEVEVNPREVWFREKPEDLYRQLRLELRCLAEGLAIHTHRLLDIPVAVASSGGKGLHVYGFTGAQPAEVCRTAAREILDDFGVFEAIRGENFFRHTHDYTAITIEVFPKQSSIEGKDLGNLMGLPLGVHRRTGKEKFFVSMKNGYGEPFVPMDPMAALAGEIPW